MYLINRGPVRETGHRILLAGSQAARPSLPRERRALFLRFVALVYGSKHCEREKWTTLTSDYTTATPPPPVASSLPCQVQISSM
jgi:hypothetical protein